MNDLVVPSANNKMAVLNNVPEELIWKADFNANNSVATYDKAIRLFLEYLGASSPDELRAVTHAHVIAFKKELQRRGMSPRTVNNRLSAISSLFDHLIDKQIVKINPAKGIKRMRVNHDRVEAKVLTPQEVRNLLDAPDPNKRQGVRDRAILHILFFTGCRISELCSLKVKDFYEEQGFWVMDFAVKGGKRNRLAVHQELVVAVHRYLKAAGHGDDLHCPLILPVKHNQKTNDDRRCLTRRAVSLIWNKYTKMSGITGSSPHSARATFITQALENNCPIEAVQRSVGHAQIKTTQMYDKRTQKYRESASFLVRY